LSDTSTGQTPKILRQSLQELADSVKDREEDICGFRDTTGKYVFPPLT